MPFTKDISEKIEPNNKQPAQEKKVKGKAMQQDPFHRNMFIIYNDKHTQEIEPCEKYSKNL